VLRRGVLSEISAHYEFRTQWQLQVARSNVAELLFVDTLKPAKTGNYVLDIGNAMGCDPALIRLELARPEALMVMFVLKRLIA
jgi:hypothetical protein